MRAHLEVVEAVLNVPRVRVDGGRHDAGEVVREEVGGVEVVVVVVVVVRVLCVSSSSSSSSSSI